MNRLNQPAGTPAIWAASSEEDAQLMAGGGRQLAGERASAASFLQPTQLKEKAHETVHPHVPPTARAARMGQGTSLPTGEDLPAREATVPTAIEAAEAV